MRKKIANVIIASGDSEKGVAVDNVFLEEDTVYFPCAKEKIGGIYYLNPRKAKKQKSKKEISASFSEYLKELKRLKCKKVVFKDELVIKV